MKTVLRAVGLVLLSAALGFALLLGVYALPQETMQHNVASSAEVFAYESGYPRLIEGWHVTMLDNFTDTVMLLTAIGGTAEESIPMQVANAPRIVYGGGNWLINHIDAYAEDGAPEQTQQTVYPRYWHGYLVTLKPMLMAFDYAQLRLVNMIAQSFLLLFVMYLLVKRAGLLYAVALTAAIACMTPFAIPLSLQFSTSYYIMLCALIWILLRRDRLAAGDRYALFFCLVGIVTNYFDFLTFPLITLGIPLCVYLLLSNGATARKSLWTAFVCCAFWAAGYALMWASKWAIATLITGNNIFADALFSINERTSLVGGGELGAGDITRLGTIRALVAMLKRRPYLLMGAGIIAGLAVQIVRKRLSVGRTPRSAHALSMLGIALLPFMWYAVMPNHSYTHYFYTFRALSVTVFALLCALLVFIKPGAAATASAFGTAPGMCADGSGGERANPS